MSKFAVYEHKTLGKKAVKEGFSAAGLFFPLIWSMYHKLWWLSAILLPWGMLAGAMNAILSNINKNDAVGFFLAQVLFFHIPAGLIFGFVGNGLLKSKLLKQGYQPVEVLEAQSPEDAVGQIASKAAPVSVAPQASGLAEQISRLNDLKQQGALSESEYQAAKAKLLS